jgi:hypothetical protein
MPHSAVDRISINVIRAAAAVAFAAVLAACGADTRTAPSTQPIVDVSALVAAASNTTYNTVARSMVLLPAVVTSPINTANCPYSSATQQFVCAPVTSNGLTFKASYQLLDASGHPLSVADATMLAAVRAITDLDGTSSFVSPTSGSVSATTIHSHADNTLSGLLTDKHILNGASSERDTLSSVFGGIASKLAITASTTTAALDVSASGGYPASGTITSDATTTSTFGSTTTPLTTTTHAVVQFNGTSVVTITLGIGSTTERCTLDLAHASNISCTPI